MRAKKISEWADHIGIPANTLHDRLNKLNWTVEQALEYEAALKKKSRATTYLTDKYGITKSAIEWAKETGIGYRIIIRRKGLSWTDVEALNPIVKKLNIRYKHNGLELTLRQWSEELRVKIGTLQTRLDRQTRLDKVFY